MGRDKIKRYDFTRDLQRGKDGEEQLVALWPDHFEAKPPKPDDMPLKAYRMYDLLHVDGRTVELKTDSYDHEGTPNFFMEKLSHGKPGGPWRSLADGVDMFVYYFPLPYPKAYVWEDVQALCDVLDSDKFCHAPGRKICNGKWSAHGLLIDRNQLEAVSDCLVLTLDKPDDGE